MQDPNLEFQDRTAVDLKDRSFTLLLFIYNDLLNGLLFTRFRTYFPDAYKKHYPNAKTHLSNKIRSTFPDGTSLFEKTRSKRRRPFTEAEDAALKAGYEKHGTTWATIVKDPIFQEQNRRSTDLRDRFRNAFPHLYQAAGYKPRTTPKKKEGPLRAADDNLSQMSKAGPVRSRRRAQSSTGYLRGGTKSVPQSTVGSEEEISDEEEGYSPFKMPSTPPVITSRASPLSRLKGSVSPSTDMSTTAIAIPPPTPSSAPSTTPAPSNNSYLDNLNDMDIVAIETESLNIMPNETHSELEAWSSGANTPTHSSTAAWSISGASPTSTHLSDFLLNPTPGNTTSNASSPFIHRQNDVFGSNTIGKSAWGQDWFSSNPRLESTNAGSNASSFIDNSFSPASPFSFHPHLNHGVLDRYDLFPPSIPNDISSDADLADTHTTFSDDIVPGSGVGGASAGGTGFRGYHSQIAGDLISGAGSRMQSFASLPLSVTNLYGTFGNSFGSSGNEILGLGLEGIPEDEGVHGMQFDAHTSDFSSIDELGIRSISLNDNLDSNAQNAASSGQHTGREMSDGTTGNGLGMDYGLPLPDDNQQQQSNQRDDPHHAELNTVGDSFRLEDLVDMSNDPHETPPATPIMRNSRAMRRSSQGSILYAFDGHGNASHHHVRSTSVPPSEARNAGGSGIVNMGNVQMSVDDVGVGLHMHSQHHAHQPHSNSHLDTTLGKGLQTFFGLHSPVPSSSSPANEVNRPQRHGRTLEPMRLSSSAGSQMQQPSSMSSPNHLHQSLSQQTQPATLFPAQLMLTSVSSSSDPISSHSQNSNHNFPHTHDSDPWRYSASASVAHTWTNAHSLNSTDFCDVPYLDLHYTTYGSVAVPGHQPGTNIGNFNTALHEPSEARQGQEALDLAQSAVLASSGLGLTNMGLNLAFGTGTNAKAPDLHGGTIRMQQHLAAGLGKQSQPPSDTFGPIAAAIAAANAIGQSGREAGGVNTGVNTQDLSGTRTIRQSHFKSSNSGFGRSMSHHRGQSAVCPQDLELTNENNKRKRASWDGGLV